MEINVYADIIFLINFIINIILLKLSSFFMKSPSGVSALCIASSLGALYAIFMFVPWLKFMYIFPCKMLVSVAMLKILSPGAKLIKTLKHAVIFYMISFCFAGVLIALSYFGAISETDAAILHGGIFYFDISLKNLIAASLICTILLGAVSGIFKRNKNLGIKKLKITLSGRMCEMSALCDSGNLLCDPLSNTPVVIAEKKHLLKLFPEGIPDITSDHITDTKLRLIPFSSLGNPNGLMTGFIPDEVRIDGKKTENVVIAISPGILSEKDEYNALFNPNILV